MEIKEWIETFKLHSKTISFEKKVEKTKKVIAEMLEKHPNSYVSWSAGKDSTALLFLVLEQKPDIRVMTEKDDLDFPGEIEYVNKLQEKYNINLDIITPPHKLWEMLDNTEFWEDLHSRNTAFSKVSFYSLIKEYKEKNNFEGVFLGLRGQESKGREWNLKKNGKIYFNKRDNDFVCCPIAEWKGEDVFAYLISQKIPILDVYSKIMFIGDPRKIRKSWAIPGAYACQGQAKWLEYYYPELFDRLVKINPVIKGYI